MGILGEPMESHMAKTVDEYISAFPKDIQEKLNLVRKTVREAAPDAKECISYQMPAYRGNHMLVFFAAFKDHIGFYPTPSGMTNFDEELARYKKGKGSIHLPLDQPLPLDLIRRIVLYRVEEDRKAK